MSTLPLHPSLTDIVARMRRSANAAERAHFERVATRVAAVSGHSLDGALAVLDACNAPTSDTAKTAKAATTAEAAKPASAAKAAEPGTGSAPEYPQQDADPTGSAATPAHPRRTPRPPRPPREPSPHVLRPFDRREVMKTEAAAKLLGKTPGTVRRLAERYGLGRRLGGGPWLLSKVAVRIFADGDGGTLRAYHDGRKDDPAVRAYFEACGLG